MSDVFSLQNAGELIFFGTSPEGDTHGHAPNSTWAAGKRSESTCQPAWHCAHCHDVARLCMTLGSFIEALGRF